MGVIFATVGGALLAFYLVEAASTRRFVRSAADAQGVVVDLKRYTRRGSDATSARSVQPVVEFVLPDGRRVSFEDALATSWDPYEVGAMVPVKYDPDDPEDARIATSARVSGGNAVFGLFGGAFFLIGAVCLVIGLI